MSPNKASSKFLWIAAIVLLVLHQDFWFWHSEQLLLGFLPIGLAYQAGYSIAAACLWGWAMQFAWPSHIEAMAEES